MVAVLADERVNHRLSEIGEVVGNVVGEVAVFGAAPHSLDGIEIGGIGREPFDAQPIGLLLPQKADRFAMDVETIQHDDQLPALLAMQLPQKGHDVGRYDVAGIELPIEIDPLPLGRKRYGPHRR